MTAWQLLLSYPSKMEWGNAMRQPNCSKSAKKGPVLYSCQQSPLCSWPLSLWQHLCSSVSCLNSLKALKINLKKAKLSSACQLNWLLKWSDKNQRRGQGTERRGRKKLYFFWSSNLLVCPSAHGQSVFLLFLFIVTLKKKKSSQALATVVKCFSYFTNQLRKTFILYTSNRLKKDNNNLWFLSFKISFSFRSNTQ